MPAELLPLDDARRKLFQRAWQLAGKIAAGTIKADEIVVSWNSSTFHINEILQRADKTGIGAYDEMAVRAGLMEEEREAARSLTFNFLDDLVRQKKVERILIRYAYPTTFSILTETTGLDRNLVTDLLNEIDANRTWSGKPMPVVAIDRVDASVESRVEVLVNGRRYYIGVEPLSAGKARLIDDVAELLEKVAPVQNVGIVAAPESPMVKIIDIVGRVSIRNVLVLIRGETGTGKEIIARMIHLNDPARRRKPFVPIDCGIFGTDRTMAASSLFGHCKGAFTGADRDKSGFVEDAADGVLFLDEIHALPIETQSLLLRFICEGTFRRLGETAERKAQCRLVAATNQNLQQSVAEGKFKDDLYSRLNIVPILLPPLRERHCDIPHLVTHFKKKICEKHGIDPGPDFTLDTVAAMSAYSWPGNVRELANILERLICLCPEGCVTPGDLPEEIRVAERVNIISAVDNAVSEFVRRLERWGAGIEDDKSIGAMLCKAISSEAGPGNIIEALRESSANGIRFRAVNGVAIALPPEYVEWVPISMICRKMPEKKIDFWCLGLAERLGMIIATLLRGDMSKKQICEDVFGMDEAYLDGAKNMKERLGAGNEAVKYLLDLAVKTARIEKRT